MMNGSIKKLNGYGYYLILWIGLISLSTMMMALSGLDLGRFSLFIYTYFSIIISGMIITLFMGIKFKEIYFSIFTGVSLFLLFISIVVAAF